MATLPGVSFADTVADRKIVVSKAYVDTIKQNKISATSNGASGSPNYVYDSTNNPTAAGSVVTTTDSAGVTGERGIATAPTYDTSNNLTNDSWIPTMGAVMNQISSATNTLTWDSSETTSANAYETHFGSGTNYWPAADETKLINTAALAQGLSLKQNKIPATLDSGYHSVLTDGDTDGAVGKLRIITADDLNDGDLFLDDYTHAIPDTDAVQNELVNHWQPKITTGSVTFRDPEENIDYTVPSLVSYGTGTNNADGVLGNKIGVLGINQNVGGLNSYDFLDIWDDEESGYLDNFVPTVRAVSGALEGLNNSTNSLWNVVSQLGWTPFSWNNNTFPAAIDAYSTTFDTTSTHVNGNWPRSSQAYLVRADTFVKSLALKQNKIPAGTTPQNLYTDGSVLTYTNSAGNVGEKYIIYSQMWDDLVTHNVTWTDDYQNMLVNAGDIANALDYKQNTIPTNHITWYEGSDDPEDDDPYEYVPALVVTNAAGTALNGNTIGIAGYEQLPSGLRDYIYSSNDNFVPTVRVVAKGLSDLYSTLNTRISNLNWSALGWNNNIAENIKRGQTYSEGWTRWPDGTQTNLINAEFLANALALKQTKIELLFTSNASAEGPARYKPIGGEMFAISAPAQTNAFNYPHHYITAGGSQPLTVKTGADNTILYVNGTKTLSEFRASNFGTSTTPSINSLYEEYIQEALVTLELLHDTYADLNTKITANSRPTGTTGTVATYNGVTNGVQQFTETAIYDPTNTYSSSDSGKLATAGFVETKQDKIPAKANGDPTKIVTYPAYGSAAGAIGELSVDTSTLNTTDDTSVPSSKLVSTSIAGKQNQIGATSDGTSGSPNYVYDSTNNQYADGSVVTTTDSAGVTGQRGIATEPVSNGNGGYSNGDWLPTVNAMMTAIAGATPTISGTANTIANFDSTGALGSGIATYNGSGYNSSTDSGKIATAAAVETKVSKTQSTGYQVLTTGTTGTVTAEYLAVPVTTSGTGRPAANNTPPGTAAIWIE